MDEYRAICIHGTLPLVPDPGSPAGVRFAVPGRDGPADCARVPAELPDAEMTLRFFAKGEEIAPYAAALAEHGGNAFACVAAPGCHAFQALLVVRHDRPRRPGATLDEAVASSVPAGAAAAWGQARARAFEGARAARARSSLAERWAPHAAAVDAVPGARRGDVGVDGVAFSRPDIPGGMSLGGDAGNPVLRWEPWGTVAMPADIAAALSERLGRLPGPSRMSMNSRGILAVQIRGLAAGDVAEGIAAMTRAASEHARAASEARGRGAMAALVAEGGSGWLLRGLAAGLPVLAAGPGRAGVMPGTGPGGCRSLFAPVVDRLERLGLTEVVWAPPGRAAGSAPVLLLGTGAVASLASGRVEEAAAATAGPRPRWRARHRGGLAGALAAVSASRTPSEALRAAAARASGEFPADGTALDELAGRKPEGWMPCVLAVLSGAATVDAEGRFNLAGQDPAPRGP